MALWIVPNVEHYEYLPKYVRTRDPWPRSPHPDVLGYSQRDYGNRVGLWRLFDLADDLDLRCTVSLNMSVIQHYPAILEGMEKRKWELMSHGIYNTRYHWHFTPEEERAAMLESREIHRRLTGREQRGWFSPAITNTLNTFDLAAECGYDYTADLYHDDQPFPLKVKSGRLLSIPYTIDLNDVILHRRGEEADEFARQIRDHFDTVYAEGADQGRVMCVALHPYWVGQPHRMRAIRSAFEYILSCPGCLANHGRGDRRMVQRELFAADRVAPGRPGGRQWLNSRPPKFHLLAKAANPEWITLIIRSAPCRMRLVSYGLMVLASLSP